jgi:hypothetical protein
LRYAVYAIAQHHVFELVRDLATLCGAHGHLSYPAPMKVPMYQAPVMSRSSPSSTPQTTVVAVNAASYNRGSRALYLRGNGVKDAELWWLSAPGGREREHFIHKRHLVAMLFFPSIRQSAALPTDQLKALKQKWQPFTSIH